MRWSQQTAENVAWSEVYWILMLPWRGGGVLWGSFLPWSICQTASLGRESTKRKLYRTEQGGCDGGLGSKRECCAASKKEEWQTQHVHTHCIRVTQISCKFKQSRRLERDSLCREGCELWVLEQYLGVISDRIKKEKVYCTKLWLEKVAVPNLFTAPIMHKASLGAVIARVIRGNHFVSEVQIN